MLKNLQTEKKKFVKYGINPDVESYYIKEQNKYDVEGPKNLFDQDQFTEYLFKICNEHPLIEYIEDPFVKGDRVGFQKGIKKFKEYLPRVKIGVKSWFKSSLKKIQKHTQLITKDADEEDAEKKPIGEPKKEEVK